MLALSLTIYLGGIMGGVKTEHGFVIYKCNKYPITYFQKE